MMTHAHGVLLKKAPRLREYSARRLLSRTGTFQPICTWRVARCRGEEREERKEAFCDTTPHQRGPTELPCSRPHAAKAVGFCVKGSRGREIPPRYAALPVAEARQASAAASEVMLGMRPISQNTRAAKFSLSVMLCSICWPLPGRAFLQSR